MLIPKGHERLTPTGITRLTVPDGANVALLRAETQNVRYRDDGTNPGTTVGSLVVAGEEKQYEGDLRKIRFLEAVGGAVLNVSYYGSGK